MEKLKTVEQYATLCEVGKAAIYARIEKGEVETLTIDVGGYPTKVIDIRKYPPVKSKPRGRKKMIN